MTDEVIQPAKRGRPANPSTSAALRQAKYRANLAAAGKAEIQVIVALDVQAALAKHIEFKDMTLGQAIDKIVRDRLLRKR
jgi:histidyl-tRNA synthetase